MDSLWTIQHRKAINKRIKEARSRSKPAKCPLCNKQLGKTCNSHSIPQMILKTIETNGHFYNKNKVDNMMFFDSELGMNNTGTFHYICNSCDSTFFQIMNAQRLFMLFRIIKFLLRLLQKISCLKCSKNHTKGLFLNTIQCYNARI